MLPLLHELAGKLGQVNDLLACLRIHSRVAPHRGCHFKIETLPRCLGQLCWKMRY